MRIMYNKQFCGKLDVFDDLLPHRVRSGRNITELNAWSETCHSPWQSSIRVLYVKRVTPYQHDHISIPPIG